MLGSGEAVVSETVTALKGIDVGMVGSVLAGMGQGGDRP